MFDLFHQREEGVTGVDRGRVDADERDHVLSVPDGRDVDEHRNVLGAALTVSGATGIRSASEGTKFTVWRVRGESNGTPRTDGAGGSAPP